LHHNFDAQRAHSLMTFPQVVLLLLRSWQRRASAVLDVEVLGIDSIAAAEVLHRGAEVCRGAERPSAVDGAEQTSWL
jgi:hypothetical protein